MNKRAIAVAATLLSAVSLAVVTHSSRTVPLREGEVHSSANDSRSENLVSNKPGNRKFYSLAIPTHLTVKNPVEIYKIDAPYTDPGRAVELAEADAERGVPGAMLALGRALHSCAMATTESDSEIIERTAKQIEGMELRDAERKSPFPTNSAAIMSEAADNQRKIRDSCRSVPTDKAANWRSWLKRSAKAGDESASQFLAMTINDAYPQATRLENYGDYIQDRNEVYNDLLESVGSGECGPNTINSISNVVPDNTSKYIFQSLLFQQALDTLPRRGWTQEQNQAERDAIMSSKAKLAVSVDPAELSEADATVGYIQSTYCQ